MQIQFGSNQKVGTFGPVIERRVDKYIQLLDLYIWCNLKQTVRSRVKRPKKERTQDLNLPDEAVEVCEVGLDLLDCLAEQPAVWSHTNISHPVDSHQCLHQPAKRMERDLARLSTWKQTCTVREYAETTTNNRSYIDLLDSVRDKSNIHTS